MSLPAVKVSPDPLSSTTRMADSSSARWNASTTARYIAPVSAFFFSGRLNRTSRTGPVRVTRTSLIGLPLSADQIVDLQREPGDQIGDLLLDDRKAGQPLDPRFVHVQ